MTFKRIGENTFRCVLTEQDMEENNIGLEDFFSNNREKIHDFLENIMEEAKKEIGYESDGAMISMQLMPLPSNGLAITITGSSDNDFKQMLGSVKDILSGITPDEDMEDVKETSADNKKSFTELSSAVREIKTPDTQVYSFESFDKVEAFCKEANSFSKLLKSVLYKDSKGTYYMEITRKRASAENFAKACLIANEFAELKENSELFVKHMEEHYDCIIASKAITKLAKI